MSTRHLARSGFSLVEVLIAATLAGMVLAVMMGTMVAQQRFYLVTSDISKTIAALHDIETAVAPEFLPLNPAASDITYVDPDSVRMRVFRGVYAVCDKRLTTDVFLTLRHLEGGSLSLADSGRVYSHGTTASIQDDHWKPVRISNIKSATCPDGTRAWEVVSAGLSGQLDEVPIGAPLRIFEYGSYWLDEGADGWVLRTDAFGGTKSVGGVLAPTDSSATSTLQFSYLDENGDPTGTLTDITQIGIVVSAFGSVPTQRDGDPYRANRTALFKLRNAE